MKSGTEYCMPCPFHGGQHYGSFKISPKKNYAKCFSCGWQGGPIDFLMEHERLSFVDALRWLGKKYSIEVEGSENFQVKPAVPRQQLPPLPMLVLPEWMWQIKFGLPAEHPFYRWLTSIKWGAAQRARLHEMLNDYRIGVDKQGRIIFWQIDEKQQVRTGKMMKYKPDGHRDNGTLPRPTHGLLSRQNRREALSVWTSSAEPLPHLATPTSVHCGKRKDRAAHGYRLRQPCGTGVDGVRRFGELEPRQDEAHY